MSVIYELQCNFGYLSTSYPNLKLFDQNIQSPSNNIFRLCSECKSVTSDAVYWFIVGPLCVKKQMVASLK